MAEDQYNPTEIDILNTVADSTGDNPIEVPAQVEYTPIYKMVGDSKRLVPKVAGKFWDARRKNAIARLRNRGLLDQWSENMQYYRRGQAENRLDGTKTASTPRHKRNKPGMVGTAEAENMVFVNTSSLLPALYAKNPKIEITPNIRDDNNDDGGEDDELRAFATVCERLMNLLANKKEGPGINLKPKAKKVVLNTLINNIAHIEIGYTRKEEASETALVDLDQLTEEYTNAKSQKELREIEGKLMALESRVAFLRASGPFANFIAPEDLIVDPESVDPDFSDANWMMVGSYLPLDLIRALYYNKKGTEEDAEYESIYQPTHVMGVSVDGVQEDINNFSLIEKNVSHKNYGFDSQEDFEKACYIRVWRVFDKTTRTILMFNEKCWDYPIWAWDDHLNLDRFFPIYTLQFYMDPEGAIGDSEVSKYLDQQDGLNEINAEMAKIRKRVMGTIVFNKNMVQNPEDINKLLNAEDLKKPIGLDMPVDADISKVFIPALLPSAQVPELLNKQTLLESINRQSSVPIVMQNVQFKTNTTNDAINTYNSQAQTRLDEKIDSIEDFLGDLMWGVLQLCLQYMPQDTVAKLLGAQAGQVWRNMTPDEIAANFSVTIVGGSTQKPTSQVKKQEALQIGQVLGQYANAGQGVVVMLLLKIMERAFDEIVISTEDWEMVRGSIMQQVQGPQTQASGGEAGMLQLAAAVDQLPPQAKMALGNAMAQGVSVTEALPKILELTQQATAGVE